MPVSTMWLRKELEYVQQQAVEQEFPERMIVNGNWIAISDEIPAGAETYSYKIMTAVGEAAILANGGDDIPMVNVYAEKRVGEIRTIVDGYRYTVEDLEAAQFAGTSLDASMALYAREIIEYKLDILGYEGSTEFNLLGLLNHPNVPSGTVAADGNQNGGSNSTRWIHKTAEQIYRDLTAFGRSPRVATNGVEFFDTIAMTEDAYNIIAETPYPSASAASETILSFYLRTQSVNPKGVKRIVSAPYLAGKGTGGTGMLVGTRKLPQKLKYHLVMDFTQEAPQQDNFAIKVPCRARTGGVQLSKPLSVGYRDGI